MAFRTIRIHMKCFHELQDLQKRLARPIADGFPPIEPVISDVVLAALRSFRKEIDDE